MNDFNYYGLFLTETAVKKLKDWISSNDETRQLLDNAEHVYLDHCTLMHHSQYDEEIAKPLNFLIEEGIVKYNILAYKIGISEKAMAFKICTNLKCTNKIPHITICTFNGGKPVDSNNITTWKNTPIFLLETILKKV